MNQNRNINQPFFFSWKLGKLTLWAAVSVCVNVDLQLASHGNLTYVAKSAGDICWIYEWVFIRHVEFPLFRQSLHQWMEKKNRLDINQAKIH